MAKVNLTVSVAMITYRHEAFLVQAIDGVLKQETSFDFNLIIADDCSPDRTEEIVRMKISSHPKGHLIKYFRHTDNLGARQNGLFALENCDGKYIALCEGDDFWLDAHKLQKQVDFLENNLDYVLTVGGFHRRDVLSGNEEMVISNYRSPDNIHGGFSFSLEDMKHQWFFSTLTSLFLNNNKMIADISNYKYCRDIHIFYHLLKLGKGYYFREALGVYNVHSQGVFSGITQVKKDEEHYLIYQELWTMCRDEFSRYIYYRVIINKAMNLIYYQGSNGFDRKLFCEAFTLIRSLKDVNYMLFKLLSNLFLSFSRIWFLERK